MKATKVIQTLTGAKAEQIAVHAACSVNDTDDPAVQASTAALARMAERWAYDADATEWGEVEIDAGDLDDNQTWLVDEALRMMGD